MSASYLLLLLLLLVFLVDKRTGRLQERGRKRYNTTHEKVQHDTDLLEAEGGEFSLRKRVVLHSLVYVVLRQKKKQKNEQSTTKNKCKLYCKYSNNTTNTPRKKIKTSRIY